MVAQLTYRVYSGNIIQFFPMTLWQVSQQDFSNWFEISGVGETEGHSEEDDVKRDFNDIKRMVKIMFDAFIVRMAGEGFKPAHGEGTLDDKKDEEKS